MDVSAKSKSSKPLILEAMQKLHCLLFVYWERQQALFNKLRDYSAQDIRQDQSFGPGLTPDRFELQSGAALLFTLV